MLLLLKFSLTLKVVIGVARKFSYLSRYFCLYIQSLWYQNWYLFSSAISNVNCFCSSEILDTFLYLFEFFKFIYVSSFLAIQCLIFMFSELIVFWGLFTVLCFLFILVVFSRLCYLLFESDFGGFWTWNVLDFELEHMVVGLSNMCLCYVIAQSEFLLVWFDINSSSL